MLEALKMKLAVGTGSPRANSGSNSGSTPVSVGSAPRSAPLGGAPADGSAMSTDGSVSSVSSASLQQLPMAGSYQYQPYVQPYMPLQVPLYPQSPPQEAVYGYGFGMPASPQGQAVFQMGKPSYYGMNDFTVPQVASLSPSDNDDLMAGGEKRRRVAQYGRPANGGAAVAPGVQNFQSAPGSGAPVYAQHSDPVPITPKMTQAPRYVPLSPQTPQQAAAPAMTMPQVPAVPTSSAHAGVSKQKAHHPRVPVITRPRKISKPHEVVLPKVVDSAPPELPCDDDGGHYNVREGERFAGRYVIVKLLGQGTFGKVAQAWDERSRCYCAIKIIRAVPKYRDASKIELRVLTMLSNYDPACQNSVIRMSECFDYRNHVCIVTGLYDISVYDFLKENQFLPFPGAHIASFAKQLLTSVAYIHSLGLVHTDLKPENVLLASSAYDMGTYRRGSRGAVTPRRELRNTEITLIDFGSAVFDDEYHSSVVSTRHYRAPEIIFGTGWSYACDLWSIGCLLIELCTGRVLFETRDNLEHLHMMEKTLKQTFPVDMLMKALAGPNAELVERVWPKLRAPDPTKVDKIHKMKTVQQLVQANTPYNRERRYWDGFIDLMRRLMTLDPNQRITAQDALRHPWLVENAH